MVRLLDAEGAVPPRGQEGDGVRACRAARWELPDAIFYPTGGGTGLIGMWKAFDELEAVGLIGPEAAAHVRGPGRGCAPIVRAFEEGDEFAERWEHAATVATGIRVPKAVGDFLILRAVRESGGAALAVEEAILQAVEDVARDDGFLLCPEGGAVLAAWRRRWSGEWSPGRARAVVQLRQRQQYPLADRSKRWR